MRTTDRDISKLSLAERIQLVEGLWDSVAAEIGGLPLTEAQVAEAGDPWEVVRGRIQERLDKAG